MADTNFKKAQMKDHGIERLRGDFAEIISKAHDDGVSIHSVIAMLTELVDFYTFERRLMWHNERQEEVKIRQELKEKELVNKLLKPGVAKKKK